MIPTFPRTKINLSPFRWDAERIRFGGFQSHLARNIHSLHLSDVIWDLCLTMDGNKEIDLIINSIAQKHNIETNAVRKVIEDMVTSGVIEDAYPDTKCFSDEELERYDRNINLFSWIDLSNETNHWQYQAKLRDSRVTILGSGGVGSHIAHNLARMGVGFIRIVDGV